MQASSSASGSIVLRACDRTVGLADALAADLRNPRQPGNLTFRERRRCLFGLALGYADGNDAARVKSAPRFKLLTGGIPGDGVELACQPTLSRLRTR